MANAKIGSQTSWGHNFVETITADRVLKPGDSGKLFMIDKSSSISAITLPKMSTGIAGWNCKFIMQVIGSSKSANIKAHADDQDTIHIRENATDGNSTTGGADKDYISLSSSSVKGDWVECVTDGTSWYMLSHSTADAGITSTG